MDDVVRERSIQDGRGVEFLASDGGPDHRKDAGADHSADAQGGQRPRAQGLLQPVFRLFGLRDQLIDRLAREELVRQIVAPGNTGIDASGFKQIPEAPGKRNLSL
jgi:hypothetical protein